MRTTVSLDDELLAQVKVIAARTHRTIGSVLEDALRKFLAEQDTAEVSFELPRFDVQRPGLRDGVDLSDKEQLADLEGANALP